MKRRLGNLERLLLAYTQMRQLRAVRTGDLTGPLGISPKQERELLGRMARSGLIVQLRRGLYLVPARLPLGTSWTPSEAQVLATLVGDGRYQVCGPNAFNRYGYTTQVPQRTYAYNNRLSLQLNAGAVAVTLIKVANRRLGETVEEKSWDGGTLVYSSRVRTLVDAVNDWARFNTLPAAYEWIGNDLRTGKVTATDLVRVTLKYADRTAIRRMGAALERAGVSDRTLGRLERSRGPIPTMVLWDPAGPRTGPILRRWGVRLNA